MSRRVVFRRFGEADVLEVVTGSRPRPGPGEIRVEVAYAGVNYADVMARRGFYKWAPPPPTCVGFEVSGVVAELGPGVTEHAVGDRVMAISRFGGYADDLVVEAARAYRVPEGMSLEHAAALPAVYVTAWQALLEVARVRPGDTVLIQAVAGGVGLAALQIARHVGCETFGTASSERKLQIAVDEGLDHPIDYARLDFAREVMRLTAGRGVDVVLDSLGGEGLRKGYACLARGGHLVTIGAAQVAPTTRARPTEWVRAGLELLRAGVFHPFQLIEDNRSIGGVQVLLLWDDLPRFRRAMDQLLAFWTAGAIRPRIDRVVPLARAADAHRALESRGTAGKLLLACAAAFR